MKNLHGNKNLCLSSLTSARNLFSECLSYDSLVPHVDKIAVALFNLENVLNSNPEVTFRYKDILDEEVAYFRRKEIPYISLVNGEINTIPFEFLNDSDFNAIAFVKEGTSGYLPSAEHYILGNEAIGQIYVEGREAFCVKFAVEHSLRSISKRWYDGCNKLIAIFERMLA